MSDPQSRNEAILQSIINGTEYTDPPQSRIEDLLIQLSAAVPANEEIKETIKSIAAAATDFADFQSKISQW